MTLLAFTLILSSAFLHATWNLLAKRIAGGAEFVWLMATMSALIYSPLALGVILIQKPTLGWLEFVMMLGTAIIHVAYFISLQRGYRVGDLSLVYPLARGSGPMLASLFAILFFQERPSVLALCGAGLIIVSVFVMAGGFRLFTDRNPNRQKAIFYGLLTGVFIASYTVWDKYAVAVVLISPLIFDWASNLGRSLILVPVAVHGWTEVKKLWREFRTELIWISILSPLAYILVLTALTTTPVSYVAPAREISILIGAVMGARFLSEGDTRRRLIAASCMVIGLIALALG